jgi:hypothetical protein
MQWRTAETWWHRSKTHTQCWFSVGRYMGAGQALLNTTAAAQRSVDAIRVDYEQHGDEEHGQLW